MSGPAEECEQGVGVEIFVFAVVVVFISVVIIVIGIIALVGVGVRRREHRFHSTRCMNCHERYRRIAVIQGVLREYGRGGILLERGFRRFSLGDGEERLRPFW